MSVASWCCKSFCVVPCVSFCTGHFVMVPLNMTYLHCLQHSLFEHLFNLYYMYVHHAYLETNFDNYVPTKTNIFISVLFNQWFSLTRKWREKWMQGRNVHNCPRKQTNLAWLEYINIILLLHLMMHWCSRTNLAYIANKYLSSNK